MEIYVFRIKVYLKRIMTPLKQSSIYMLATLCIQIKYLMKFHIATIITFIKLKLLTLRFESRVFLKITAYKNFLHRIILVDSDY